MMQAALVRHSDALDDDTKGVVMTRILRLFARLEELTGEQGMFLLRYDFWHPSLEPDPEKIRQHLVPWDWQDRHYQRWISRLAPSAAKWLLRPATRQNPYWHQESRRVFELTFPREFGVTPLDLVQYAKQIVIPTYQRLDARLAGAGISVHDREVIYQTVFATRRIISD